MSILELPNLRDSLQDCAPDCFDCGMSIDRVVADPSKSPVTIQISFSFYPDGEEEQTDDVIVMHWKGALDDLHTWNTKRGKFEEAVIEEIGEVVDSYRW